MTTPERPIAEIYNEAARAYDTHLSDSTNSPLHAYYEKPAMHAALPELENPTVLDIGAGNGTEAQWANRELSRDVDDTAQYM